MNSKTIRIQSQWS